MRLAILLAFSRRASLAVAAVLSRALWLFLHRREKRFGNFANYFPDALDSLARALRAGYPLSAAMEMISMETGPPVSMEIRSTSAEANLGRGWPSRAGKSGQRIPCSR